MSLIEIKKKLLMAQKGGLDVSDVFNTSLWTGTGSSRTITTGIDSTDGSLVWIKQRSASNDNILSNTIVGGGITSLSSNTTGASFTGRINSVSSTGYIVSNHFTVNGTGGTYVGWQFRRAEKFFDIVQYTGDGVSGRAIAHNLGVAPGLIITKNLNATSNWAIYHISRGASQIGIFTSTAFLNNTAYWNGVEPDDREYTVTADLAVNRGGDQYIAYLFAHDPAPDGIIQCGSYVGNGSATGPVVDLGWRPQYLMIKNATATGDWQIIDAQRGLTSANDAILLANTNGSETSANLVNPSATGFQLASTASNVNTNGQTYIYMAIREAI